MQENRCLGRDLGCLDERLDLLQTVRDQHPARRKIADQEFIALLGQLGCGTDVDDQWHLTLFADLCNGKRAGKVKGADHALRALVNRSFRLRARDIGVRLHVDMHEFDLVAHIGQHRGGHQRAAVTTLSGLGEIPRLRQQYRNLQ